MVDRELEGDWVAERDFGIDRLLLDFDEEQRAPAVPSQFASPNGDRTEFEAFYADNVQPAASGGLQHRRTSRSPVATSRPEQFRGLGQIMRDFCGGNARTTVEQNFVLRWVRDESVYDVYKALARARPRRRRGRNR